MRRAAVLVLLFAPMIARAEDIEARKVVDRAISVCGGTQRVARLARAEWTLAGSLNTPSGASDAAQDILVSYPDRFRTSVELSVEARKQTVVMALVRGEGWRSRAGETVALTPAEADEFRMEVHAHWLSTLAALSDPRLTLEARPAAKVQDFDADVVRVTMKNRPTVDLFFHRGAGVLIKSSFKGRDSGLDVVKDVYYSEYKPTEGLLMPTRIVHFQSGRQSASWAVRGVKFLDSVDEAKFTGP